MKQRRAQRAAEQGSSKPEGEPRETMVAAIAEVRREGVKAATIHALVEATLIALAVNLAITVADLAVLDRDLSLPAAVSGAIGAGDVGVGIILTVAVWLVAVAVGLTRRLNRPTIERFEAVNPSVAEALRTARDAVEAGEETPIARALYADVVARLRGTSSRRLVAVRRLATTIVLVLVVSLLTVQASVWGVTVADAGIPGIGSPADVEPENGGTGGAVDPEPSPGDTGDTSDVLGEPEDVSAGSEEIPVPVEVGQGAGGDGSGEVYQGDVTSEPGAVDPQLAGYAPQPELEDADVIREYNLRIREEEDG